MTAQYRDRRYLVVDGRLKKKWSTPPEPGWFVEKADAWAAHAEKIAEAKASDEALAAKKVVEDQSGTDAQPPPKAAPPKRKKAKRKKVVRRGKTGRPRKETAAESPAEGTA